MELVNRRQIEAEFRRRFVELTASQKLRVLELIGTPPDVSQIPDALWKRFEDERTAALLLLLASVFAANAEQHGLDPSILQVTSNEFALRRANDVIPKHVRGLRDYLGTPPAELLRRAERLGVRISNGGIVTPDVPIDTNSPAGATRFHAIDRLRGEASTELLNRIETAFGEAATESLVRTEFTTASAGGAEFTIQVRGLASESDYWVTRPEKSQSGPCKVCAPLDRQPRSIWTRVYANGPPGHPGCVCNISYAAIRANALATA